MKKYILVNVGGGVVSLCEQVADFDAEGLAQLRNGVNQLLPPPEPEEAEDATGDEQDA